VNIPSDKKIILFDGVCNLCNASVQFLIKRDTGDHFVFGSLQGGPGQELLKKFNQPGMLSDTFLLIEGNRVYSRSTAVLRVLKTLGKGWQLFYVLMLIPAFLRDLLYNLIAKSRYRWFGKRETCMVPQPSWKSKFLDEA
jgi:predicted DCC family thiol-disulfide oxidoreductase YuxK